MRRYACLLIAAAACASGQPAHAEIVHPVREGVMCLSARALAILTLPNGDSRTHRPGHDGNDLEIASAGGCVDLRPDMALDVHRSYHNTSLVWVLQQDGARSPLYRVPNIDLRFEDAAPAVQPQDEPGPVGGGDDTGGYVVKQQFRIGGGGVTIALLQDRRLSPSVFNDLWRAGRSGMSEARKKGLLTGGPLLHARLRLTEDGSAEWRTRDVGYPLATLSPLGGDGAAFSLHVDTTDRQASRITEEKLLPAAHGLTPLPERLSDQAAAGDAPARLPPQPAAGNSGPVQPPPVAGGGR